MRASKYNELNDPVWLHQKYIVEKLSTGEIAKIIGSTGNSVRQYLRHHNIPVFNLREGIVRRREDDGFIFDDTTKSLIDGCLLGDSSLHISNKKSDLAAPAFRRLNKFKSHVEFICKAVGCDIHRVKKGTRKNDDRTYYYFSTLTHDCLIPVYRKWYPASNNFIKVVPNDLVLTRTTLLHWFLDDGSAVKREDREGHQIVISLSTQGFTKEENIFLRDLLASTFSLRASLVRVIGGSGYRLQIVQSHAMAFYDVIGECPIPVFDYKWKFPKPGEEAEQRIPIESYVELAEILTDQNDGKLPGPNILRRDHMALYCAIGRNPTAFDHINQDARRHKLKPADHVIIAEEIARENGGVLPSGGRLAKEHDTLYRCMRKFPEKFQHIPQTPTEDRISSDEYVVLAEQLAANNGGALPIPRKLYENHGALYAIMLKYPHKFAHIPQNRKVPKINKINP